MNWYQDQSLEEIRYEDYMVSRKQSVACSIVDGQKQQKQSFAFGATLTAQQANNRLFVGKFFKNIR